MRCSGWHFALIAFGLQLFACSGEDFHTVDSATTGGAEAGGGESGGTGGKDTIGSGGQSSGGSSSGGAASGGNGTGGGASGGAPTGGTSSGGSGGEMNTGGTGGTFNPDIPRDGLVLWLRADAGITQATGQRVAAWQDVSQKDVSALQTANTWRPTLVDGGLNGKPTVQFDGVDDYLSLPDGSGDFSAGLSMFIVLQEDAAPDACTAYLEFSNGSEKDDISFGNWQDHLLYEVSENFTSAQDPLLLGEGQQVTYIHGKGETIHLRRGADEIVLSSSSFALPALPATEERTQNFIGRSLYTNCQPFAGRISEILMYDRGVEDAELVKIESYLQARWLNP